MSGAGERARLSALTTLRFLAAFYVVIYHAYPAADPSSTASVALRAWYTFCNHGFCAVGFFFVLSGFILAYNYPGDAPVAASSFYRARFARIYPVYVLGLIVALPFLASRTLRDASWGHAALEVALAVSLTQAWVPAFWSAVNIPGWSLSVEAFFYAIYPRIVAPLARATASPPRASGVLLLCLASALVGPAIGTWVYGIGHDTTSLTANLLRYAPPLALPEFAFGVVLGHLRLRDAALPRRVAPVYLPALFVLALVLCSDAVPYLFLHNAVLLPLYALVILRCSDERDAPRYLQHRWGVALGEASYALYILHLSVWIYVKIALERSGIDPLAPWVFPVYAPIAVIVSLIACTQLEQPARRRLYPTSLRKNTSNVCDAARQL